MGATKGFKRAWRHRSKGAKRRNAAQMKADVSRRERRDVRRTLKADPEDIQPKKQWKTTSWDVT